MDAVVRVGKESFETLTATQSIRMLLTTMMMIDLYCECFLMLPLYFHLDLI